MGGLDTRAAVLAPGVMLLQRLGLRARLALLMLCVAAPIVCATEIAVRHAPPDDASWLRASGLIAGATVLYLLAAFVHGTAQALQGLQTALAQLASGDFASRTVGSGTGDLARIGQTLDEVMGKVSQTVSEVRSNSAMVAQSGLKLAQDAQALAAHAEAQARNLEQTAVSVREITLAVGQTAAGATAVDEMASEVRLVAEAGGAAVVSAVQSIADIQTSSRRVQEIIGVIEGIAFQTNILALNAAVEAARAGEQGRGFAVVASEVRSLAQRSAASAKEIKTLIGESVAHVEQGVAQITGTQSTFERIVGGIRQVADSVREISHNARHQSEALASVSHSVAHLDDITRQNAQVVDQAADSSAQLNERAQRLSASVASFRLRQGSADEALALVHKAMAVYRAEGTRALAHVTAQGQTFADRDMYVFAFDRQGIYRAFAGKPEKVGTSVRDVPGVDGDKLVHDAFERAAHGGGWVDYDFANPQTGAVDLKTSYVLPLSDSLIMGCGVYKARGGPAASGAAARGAGVRPAVNPGAMTSARALA